MCRRPQSLPLAIITVLVLSATHAISQTTDAPPKNPDAEIVTTQSTPPKDDAIPSGHDPKATPAQKANEAWSTLSSAVQDPKHADLRIQALAALGTLGSNPRSLKMITTTMSDPDVDVRTAAILAAGQTNSRNLTTDIRALLDDKEPQVAFTAASTLWKMHDRSGEDVLIAIVNGDRSANATIVNGARHSVNKTIHSPAALAKFGAQQGASLLLGPFGFGLAAIEYMHKNSSSPDTARVIAIEQIAQEKTGPVRTELVAALEDKDPAVRAAAAKALGNYHNAVDSTSLYPLLDDPKAPVRLTAAAAYINSTSPTHIRKLHVVHHQ